jgi:hypothetical protein
MSESENNTPPSTVIEDTLDEIVEVPSTVAQAEFPAETAPVKEEPVSQPVQEEAVNTTPVMNVDITDSPLKPAGERRPGETIPIPSDTTDSINDLVRRIPNIDYGSDKNKRRWGYNLNQSTEFYPYDDVAYKSLTRPGSNWGQRVQTPSGILAGSYPAFKASKTELTGETAVSRLRAYRDLGSMYRIPLWNSGLWMVFKAPPETALLNLHNMIMQDKITMGRESYGLSFSNLTAIFVDRVTAFALEYLYVTNLKLPQGADIRDYIKGNDAYALAIGICAAFWPKGFNYSRSCTADPEKCNHLMTDLIDISKTLYVDRSALTPWQISHMSKVSPASVTVEDVKRYQDEMLNAQTRLVTIDEESGMPVNVTLKIPMLLQYIESGQRWINEMGALVERSLTKDKENDSRNAHMIENAKATNLRQYTHWIESVQWGDDPAVTDTESIERLLDGMSSDDYLRDSLLEKIGDYIAYSTITVVGVPSYVCPSCGKVNESDKKHPTIRSVIPLDVYQTFFALVAQRVQRISTR